MVDQLSSKDIAWDLSPLFPSPESNELKERKAHISTLVETFVENYKGKIAYLGNNPPEILTLLKTYEEIMVEYSEYSQYCNLSFAANMVLKENQQLYNTMQNFRTVIGKQLTFLDLEMGAMLSKFPELLQDPVLSNYKHYLERLSREYPHTLSELEEKLILEKNQYGVNAWSTLQSQWLNTRKMYVEVEGEKKLLSYGEANGLLSHPDKNTRKSANKAIYGKLGEDQIIFSSALRNVCGDWVKTYKKRKFDNPLGQSLLANDTDEQTIMNLMTAVKSNANIYQDYLKHKAKLMNMPKLGCEDVIAPLPNVKAEKADWVSGQEMILKAYGDFDPELQGFVKDMFEMNRIDAASRNGKQNGAFCSGWEKGKSAFILMTYNDTIGDIYTLAHELGHSVHDHYIFRNQTGLNTNLSMCVAETASIFGELLLTDLMMEKMQDKEKKRAILAHILDEAGMAIFQVGSRFWFERSLYESIEAGQNLDGETISKLWTQARDDAYGDAIEWFEEMRWEWTMKPHYYIPNFRYYNYPYVYAQLFVYSLYKLYKQDRDAFIPKFKNLLKAGSSISATEAGNLMGLDVSSPEFWKLGLDLYQDFTQQLKSLSD